MSENKKPRLLFGGVFATHTEWDENGNVVERDEFHTRLYWELWTSGAMKNLKGPRLHVLLTIVQHSDRNGEGFPGIRRMAELLPYNKDTIAKTVRELIELGFLERDEQQRSEEGKFQDIKYRIKFVMPTPCPKKPDTDKTQENQRLHPCPKKPDTVLPDTVNPDIRKSISKKDFDDDGSATVSKPWEKDFQYMAFRQQFTNNGGSDIRKHEDHYDKFLDAKEKIGYGKLCELADAYIKQVKAGKHSHKDRGAQIVWFLNGGWQNFALDRKEKPMPKNEKKVLSPEERQNIEDAARRALEEEERKIQELAAARSVGTGLDVMFQQLVRVKGGKA